MSTPKVPNFHMHQGKKALPITRLGARRNINGTTVSSSSSQSDSSSSISQQKHQQARRRRRGNNNQQRTNYVSGSDTQLSYSSSSHSGSSISGISGYSAGMMMSLPNHRDHKHNHQFDDQSMLSSSIAEEPHHAQSQHEYFDDDIDENEKYHGRYDLTASIKQQLTKPPKKLSVMALMLLPFTLLCGYMTSPGQLFPHSRYPTPLDDVIFNELSTVWETSSVGSGSTHFMLPGFSTSSEKRRSDPKRGEVDGRIVNEPSHLRLCRALLEDERRAEKGLPLDKQLVVRTKRKVVKKISKVVDGSGRRLSEEETEGGSAAAEAAAEAASDATGGANQMNANVTPPRNGGRLTVIEEDESVCRDTSSPHRSLLSMFASAFIAHAHSLSSILNAGGKNQLIYQHNCGTRMAFRSKGGRGDWTLSTMQEMMPPHFKFPGNAVHDSADTQVRMVSHLCHECVDEYDGFMKLMMEHHAAAADAAAKKDADKDKDAAPLGSGMWENWRMQLHYPSCLLKSAPSPDILLWSPDQDENNSEPTTLAKAVPTPEEEKSAAAVKSKAQVVPDEGTQGTLLNVEGKSFLIVQVNGQQVAIPQGDATAASTIQGEEATGTNTTEKHGESSVAAQNEAAAPAETSPEVSVDVSGDGPSTATTSSTSVVSSELQDKAIKSSIAKSSEEQEAGTSEAVPSSVVESTTSSSAATIKGTSTVVSATIPEESVQGKTVATEEAAASKETPSAEATTATHNGAATTTTSSTESTAKRGSSTTSGATQTLNDAIVKEATSTTSGSRTAIEAPVPEIATQDAETKAETTSIVATTASATEPEAATEEVVEFVEEATERRRLSSANTMASLTPHSLVEAILPSIRLNVRLAAIEWRDTMKQTKGNVLWFSKALFGDNVPDDADMPTEDGTVIYIDCADEHCDSSKFSESLAMPFYVYAADIPRSVTNIAVLVNEKCANLIPGCSAHGIALKDFLGRMYPRISVTYGVPPSTSHALSRMTLARQLICPPGVSCLLPGLAKGQKSTLVADDERYPWLEPLVEKAQLMDISILKRKVDVEKEVMIVKDGQVEGKVTPKVGTAGSAATKTSGGIDFQMGIPISSSNPEDLTAFLTQQPHDKTMCKNLRGRVGRWVHDLEYAAKAQYNNPLQVYAGKAERLFEPSVLNPYRKPTTYRYEDTLYPSCTPELFNVEGFCEVMGEMEMPRMMFVGDSLTFQFSQSVWKLLGNDSDPGRDDLGTWTKQIACPVGSVYDEITFTFVRNDQLNDVSEGTSFGTPNCFDYCYPWVTEYQSNPARTLLVFNTGAHRYKHPLMQNDIKQFLELLDSIDRPATNDESVKKDVFLFRSTVPGHKECEKMNIEPYGSYDEYIRFWTDKYSWNNFAGYNDFVDRKMEDRKSILRANPNSGFKDIEILDVFPMTVLRPDGHASSMDCGGDGCGRKDCLHYSLPGPPDWWTHLMYSQLKDMAELEKREKKEDADTKAR